MAGYSKGIVDTRKLNKNNKARLGRRGDTEIREVDNRESHVSALEAYLIDVNGKAGEEYVKRVGAGTVNPLTGMPEYHEASPHGEEHTHGTKSVPNIQGGVTVGMKEVTDYDNVIIAPPAPPPDPYEPPHGRQDYETLSQMTTGQLEDYLQSEFDIGEDKMEYIEGFQTEPFGILEDAQDIAETGATYTRDISQRELGDMRTDALSGLENVRTDTLGGLQNIRTDTLSGLQTGYEDIMGGLRSQSGALSRTAGRGLRQVGGAKATAASRSGFAASGTVTQAYETQKKDLFQDYTAGMRDVQRGRKSATRDLGLGTARAERDYTRGVGITERDYTRGVGITERDYTQGMGDATSAYDLAMRGSDLDFTQGTWLEQRRQLEGFYADIGAIPA